LTRYDLNHKILGRAKATTVHNTEQERLISSERLQKRSDADAKDVPKTGLNILLFGVWAPGGNLK